MDIAFKPCFSINHVEHVEPTNLYH